MDSGAFEIYTAVFSNEWNNDLLIKTTKEINPDIVVSLDHICVDPKSPCLVDLSNYNVMRNKLKENQQFYEIVIHGNRISTIKSFLDNLELDKKLLAICIPERNLIMVSFSFFIVFSYFLISDRCLLCFTPPTDYPPARSLQFQT